MMARDDFDPLAPQREAAFFYGLFLRGHRVEDLRQDIDVPRNMLEKWLRAPDFEMTFTWPPTAFSYSAGITPLTAATS